jgi:DNA-binding MarR family transcriptional regulator
VYILLLIMSKKKDSAVKEEAAELSRYEVAHCSECTCFNLRKATRVVQNLFDEAFRTIGLKGTQFTVLSHIFSYGPISLTKLADIMLLDRTTLARNLSPLEKKGFIEINPGSDLRTRYIDITEKGRRLLSKALPLWEKTQERIKNDLGNEKWDSMISNISQLISQVQGNQR